MCNPSPELSGSCQSLIVWTLPEILLHNHHTVVTTEIYPHFKKISWIQFTVQLFTNKKVTLTKFLQNNCGGKFFKFPHCAPNTCHQSLIVWNLREIALCLHYHQTLVMISRPKLSPIWSPSQSWIRGWNGHWFGSSMSWIRGRNPRQNWHFLVSNLPLSCFSKQFFKWFVRQS